MTERYHYTESGLDFVYLANGFAIRETPRGQVVSFTDLDGLVARRNSGTPYSVNHWPSRSWS